jgi:hypothetical protein
MLYDLTQLIKQKSRELILTRRRLLSSAAFAALAAGAAAHPLGRAALAETSPVTEQKPTLLRIARDTYPHEALLDDKPYETVVDSLLAEAHGDAKVAAIVADGLAELQKHAQATFNCSYVDVKDADEREALLRTIQMSELFQKLRGALLMGIYNNKALWPQFGYDGSSWEEGGFINRGFDKIDWF